MPYVVGIVLSGGVAALARSTGLDRDRAFSVMIGFVIAAIAGFKASEWIVVGAGGARHLRCAASVHRGQRGAAGVLAWLIHAGVLRASRQAH